jgi:hypothetical protein
LLRQFPEDTVVQINYLPTIRSQLALKRDDPLKAIADLQGGAPYERGTTAPFGTLFYVRGQAYLAKHRGSEAAAEFQKILSHRRAVRNSPVCVLAHLQIGRAFALSGAKTKAKTAYQDFLNLWKDADLYIPILRQAKAEYAKLS